jgi:hypothetical protein
MKTERKQIGGVMNLDDTNDIIPSGHHKEARNIVFRGSQGSLSAQNILGNRNIATSLPTGTNSCIGSHYDAQKQRLFYFNFNSNGNHGIYIYNTIPKTIQVLFLNNTHSSGDVLGFNINNPITSINIMYNDAYKPSLDLDGDVLYWVDSLGRPSKLNIDRKLAGVYASYKRSYLDVAKAPPAMPIKCTYENDTIVTNNNLKNSLFQFIYRWVYDDGEKSVWSSASMVPLPYMPNNQDIASDPKKNSRINLFFSTGDETVKKIELAVRINSDNVTSDYNLITSINKEDTLLPVSDNTVSNYYFFNSTNLLPIDKAESLLLFDYVPQKANAQEMVNGNTLVYGGITEGYDQVKNVDISMVTSTTNAFTEVPGALFFAHQNGVASFGGGNSIIVQLTGMGANDSANTPETILGIVGADFTIKFKNAAGSSFTVNYNNNVYSDITDVLTELGINATSQGFTVTFLYGNRMVISSVTELFLEGAYILTDLGNAPYLTDYTKNILYTSQSSSNYKYGVVYYDDKGRTNGVVTSAAQPTLSGTYYSGLRLTTPVWNSDTNFPSVRMEISQAPPSWASYYHVVRTANLTYDKSLFWVSERAFVKAASVGASSEQFAISYIGIGNMIKYNEQVQSTSGYIGYDYAPGDRVKFIKRVSAIGSSVVLPAGLDFEIIGMESNPNINGYIAEGTYIKIKYPTSYISSDFKFLDPNPIVYSGTATAVEDFQSYEIQIYSYKKSSVDSEVFYEIGHQYAIGTVGSTRYHIAPQGSQVIGVNPAVIWLNQGDEFYRFRDVPVGQTYTFSAGNYGQNGTSGANNGVFSTAIINVWDSKNTPKTISTTYYEIKSQVLPASTCSLVASDYPNNATADYLFYNKSSSITQTIRVSGKIIANKTVDKEQFVMVHAKIVNASGATIQTILQRKAISTTNDKYEFDFDAKVVVGPLSRMFIVTQCDSQVPNPLFIGASDFKIEVVNNAQIGIIESSFSDITKMSLNSNSRPLVYDENARQTYYPTLVRFGMQKEAGTDINNSNRFHAANMDEYDRAKGDIMRFKIRGSKMKVFQKRACGVVGVLENMMFNADGSNNLIQTNKLLNQINYYQGEYGIGNLSTSLTSSARADYFVDPIRGYQLRLSEDGLTPISSIYKAQFFITSLANKYINGTAGTLGGLAKVLGVYDFYEEEYISVFQGFSGQANTTLGFNELRNSYTSFYDYAPEWITSTEGSLVSFRNGQLYVHDSTTYCNFYGTQYKPSIKLVFNEIQNIKKRYNTISMLCNKKWIPDANGDITTNLGQSSSLQDADFLYKDDKLHASFKRDASSTGGLYNGNVLKGNWAQINLKPVNGNEFVNLFYIELGILEPFYNR